MKIFKLNLTEMLVTIQYLLQTLFYFEMVFEVLKPCCTVKYVQFACKFYLVSRNLAPSWCNPGLRVGANICTCTRHNTIPEPRAQSSQLTAQQECTTASGHNSQHCTREVIHAHQCPHGGNRFERRNAGTPSPCSRGC